mmetsp:Transcript_17614/g.38485  ORF Transcript_17614/g.38485 Transcript_17614/m.38485 type:complete len:226 (-) Transcript_17614:158-835(-)
MTLINIQQQSQNFFHFFRRPVRFTHVSCQFTFCGLVSPLSLFQNLVFSRWNCLALQQTDHVGTGSICNGQIEGSIVVVVLLGCTLRISIVQGLYHLKRSVVMGGIMQREVAVVVLLRGTFWVDFQQETFHLEGSLLPCGEMKGEIPVIICNRRSLGIGLKEGLCDFNWSPKGSSRVQRQISSIVANLCFVLGGRINGTTNRSFPALCQFMQVDIFSRCCHYCSTF